VDDVGTGKDGSPRAGGGVPWALVVVLGLAALGFGAYLTMRPAAAPGPAPVVAPAGATATNAPSAGPASADALVASGRALYAERCVSCHGPEGRGDGPIAKAMNTTVPANLADADWKHGEAPEQVLAVLNAGVKGTSMPGYRGIVAEADLKALAAYVYALGGKPVPEVLR
jgi:cytochrome c oxidase cbb3-type subunit 3